MSEPMPTPADIRAEPAGPRIDEWLCEFVLRLHHVGGLVRPLGQPDLAIYRGPAGDRVADGTLSTTGDGMLRVVAAMRPRTPAWYFHLENGYGPEEYYAMFSRDITHWHGACAPTGPLAVARAALQAMRGEAPLDAQPPPLNPDDQLPDHAGSATRSPISSQ